MALMAVDSVRWAWSWPMPAWGRSAAAIERWPVNWASSAACRYGSSGTSRNRTQASSTGGPTGASGSPV